MLLEIFDVEHGQCTLITADSGAHMLIDAGHNVSQRWRPSTMLSARRITTIDRLIVTNFDEDHASDLHNVLQVADIGILHRNPTVDADSLFRLKELGGIGAGIRALGGLMQTHIHPVVAHPDLGGVEIKQFYNRYPDDFDDENNLSLLCILKWPEITFAYTGDLEAPAWRMLLQREEVRRALQDVNVFIASHHGRLNGYCDEIFTETGMVPEIVVVSDSGIDYETQRTGPLYRARASGINLHGQIRRVLTTRRDGNITIRFGRGRPASITTSRRGPPMF